MKASNSRLLASALKRPMDRGSKVHLNFDSAKNRWRHTSGPIAGVHLCWYNCGQEVVNGQTYTTWEQLPD